MAASDIDRWLSELGLEPLERAERDGATSWDLVLDGRRRRGLRMTLILDPAVALVCWAHFAPMLNDNQRKAYHQLLRWNDELPFAKFALSEEERPLLTMEVPVDALDRDVVGSLVARVLAIADLIHLTAVNMMGELARDQSKLSTTVRSPVGVELLERYSEAVAELT